MTLAMPILWGATTLALLVLFAGAGVEADLRHAESEVLMLLGEGPATSLDLVKRWVPGSRLGRGNVHTVLHRLEDRGLVVFSESPGPHGPRRVYRLAER